MRSVKSLDGLKSDASTKSVMPPQNGGQGQAGADHREVFAQFATSLEQALTELGFLAPQAAGSGQDAAPADVASNARNQKARAHARQIS